MPEPTPIFTVSPVMIRNRPVFFLFLILALSLGVYFILTSQFVLVGYLLLAVTSLSFLRWWLQTVTTRLEITSTNVLKHQGLIALSSVQMRHSNIQNTYVRQTAFQRIMGVGDVGFSSAGEGGVEVVVSGIKAPRKVKDQIERLLDSPSVSLAENSNQDSTQTEPHQLSSLPLGHAPIDGHARVARSVEKIPTTESVDDAWNHVLNHCGLDESERQSNDALHNSTNVSLKGHLGADFHCDTPISKGLEFTIIWFSGRRNPAKLVEFDKSKHNLKIAIYRKDRTGPSRTYSLSVSPLNSGSLVTLEMEDRGVGLFRLASDKIGGWFGKDPLAKIVMESYGGRGIRCNET